MSKVYTKDDICIKRDNFTKRIGYVCSVRGADPEPDFEGSGPMAGGPEEVLRTVV